MSDLRDEAEYRASLPRKRVVAAILAFYGERLLIVKPSYRPYWLVPGGVVEAFEEPATAARRECFEEIGLELEPTSLLAVDHVSEREPFADEAVHFLFGVRDLANVDIAQIVVKPGEITEFALVDVAEAVAQLSPGLAKRVRVACERRGTAYCQNGVRVL